jgi:hypothetical protein
MFTLPFILADGVTIKLGNNVWSFGINFLIYLIVAAVIHWLSRRVPGWQTAPLRLRGGHHRRAGWNLVAHQGHRHQWDWGYQRLWGPHSESAGWCDHPGGHLATPDLWSGT